MKPPKDAEIFETTISSYWFDENGILCAQAKKGERKIEHYQETIELYKRLTKGGKKLCVLADANNAMPMSKEVNDFVSAEHPKYLKAMAIVMPTPLENSQVNTFLKLTWVGFPVMKFTTVKEAKDWLKDYL